MLGLRYAHVEASLRPCCAVDTPLLRRRAALVGRCLRLLHGELLRHLHAEDESVDVDAFLQRVEVVLRERLEALADLLRLHRRRISNIRRVSSAR